ncbi:MAG: flagellar hook capping family protein [Rhodospirillaceae bacterium]|nr:flagellar hook capping family protein [Rhodospirillaceae bacterium]
MDAVTAAGTTLSGNQVTAQQSLDQTLDNFLLMLTTQLQYQDPLDPLDTAEFTNQLVGFSTVEQLIAQNQKLDELIAAQTTTAPLQTALGYIGMEVEVQGSGFSYTGQPVRLAYQLESSSALTKVSIVDAAGNQVWSTSGSTASGTHTLTWNGTNGDGDAVDPGAYFLKVEALDIDGNAVATAPYVTGLVTGVESYDGKILLAVGDLFVDLNDVLAVRQPLQSTDSDA